MPFIRALWVPLTLTSLLIATGCGSASSTSTPPAPEGGGATLDGGGTTPNGGGDAAVPLASQGFPAAVAGALTVCANCHGPESTGRVPLTVPGDFTEAMRASSLQKVNAGTMPKAPFTLSAAQKTALVDWLTNGMPPGDTQVFEPASKTSLFTTTLSCNVDQKLRPQAAWTMPEDKSNEYVCYGVDIPVASKRHLIGMGAKVDNIKIVHHVLLFQSDKSYSTTPIPCEPDESMDWRMIYGWAPGGQSHELPEAAGFPQEGTAHYVVQVHYNNARGLVGETDKTGFDLCTTDKLRANDADMAAFGGVDFNIPARSTHSIQCDMAVPEVLSGLHIIAAFPHMHSVGAAINTYVKRAAGGANVTLANEQRWNFNDQPWFAVDTVLHTNDTVHTECTWANPATTAVAYGPYTEDEMCYTFVTYYPRIVLPNWVWAAPVKLSTCSEK